MSRLHLPRSPILGSSPPAAKIQPFYFYNQPSRTHARRGRGERGGRPLASGGGSGPQPTDDATNHVQSRLAHYLHHSRPNLLYVHRLEEQDNVKNITLSAPLGNVSTRGTPAVAEAPAYPLPH